MRRVGRISAAGSSASIKVTIQIDTKKGELASWEVSGMMDDLADEIMMSVSRARYINTPLSKIKVGK